jgi:hypothetical protein
MSKVDDLVKTFRDANPMYPDIQMRSFDFYKKYESILEPTYSSTVSEIKVLESEVDTLDLQYETFTDTLTNFKETIKDKLD